MFSVLIGILFVLGGLIYGKNGADPPQATEMRCDASVTRAECDDPGRFRVNRCIKKPGFRVERDGGGVLTRASARLEAHTVGGNGVKYFTLKFPHPGC